jgi:hypothetical protein
MDDQTELFDQSSEHVCPLAKKHDSKNVCVLGKYLQYLEDINKKLGYLNNNTWNFWLRLKD